MSPMEDDGAPSSSFPIQRLLSGLLKFWWLLVLTLALGLGVAVFFVLNEPPTFTSKASMWETVKIHLPEGGLFAEDVQNFLGTQTELLQSDTLRERALDRLKTSRKDVAIPLETDGQPLPVTVRVSGSAKSSVFTLQATSSHAAYAQAYLDSLMAVYLEYKKNIRKQVSGSTLNSITEEVQQAERDLKRDQDILLEFQRSNNLAILQQQGAVAGSYLATLQTKLSDLLLENRLLQATALDQAQAGASVTNASAGTNVLALTSLSPSGSPEATSERQTASKELELLKIQRAKLSVNLRPKHPKIVKLDADIERAEKLMEIYARQSREQLLASRQSLQLRIDNVQKSIAEWQTNVISANTLLADAERLKINIQRDQTIYDRLNVLMQNVGISRNIDQETLAILEQAAPSKRSYTHETGILAAGGVSGLGLGLGLILLIVLRDDRLGSVTEVNSRLGQVIVGQVPEVRRLKRNDALPLVQIDDARHAYAESFRSLRSALIFMVTDAQRPKVVLITSAIPGEGKSTVAANLARTLALGGASVVLVDGDMRKGKLHDLMGLPQQPGLAEALSAPGELDKVIQTNCLPNLSFIARGSAPGHSGDLLLASRLDELLTQLRDRFDYVLIDSSPVFAADDASTLAPMVDGTLFVVRSRFSRAGAVREAIELLYQRNARVLGVIFNQANASSRSYYYYKYADYHAAGGKLKTES
jgi:polysaccharide biosynthesis transport protein